MDDVIRQLDAPLLLGDVAIDHYSYYEEGDVLYLTAGPPRVAADTDESLEGDTLFFDESHRIIGVTIIGARELLEREGCLSITPPRCHTTRLTRRAVEPLLHETLRYA